MQLMLALLLQAVPQPAQQPDIDTIRTAMLERLRHDADRQVVGAKWIKERTDEDITKPLEPKVERRERYLVWGDGARMLQQKTERNGSAVRERPEPLPFFLEPALLGRFTFVLDDPSEVCCGGRECWRLAFAPRSGVSPDSGDLEQTLLWSSAGTLLVEKETYAIVRADARLLEPYRTWKFNVEWFTVSLTQERVGDTAITSTIELAYHYDPLFGGPKTKRRFYRAVHIFLPPSP